MKLSLYIQRIDASLFFDRSDIMSFDGDLLMAAH